MKLGMFAAALVAWGLMPGAAQAANVVALEVAVVTTGGVAVTVLSPGRATKGGWLMTNNAAGMCANMRGAATTTNSGDTACVVAGQTYHIPETGGAVSVNSTGAAVAIAGNGLQ